MGWSILRRRKVFGHDGGDSDPECDWSGSEQAADDLLPLVYDELRRLAAVRSLTSGRDRRCRRPRWSMKPICDSSGTARPRSGNIAVISLPPRPRPCGRILVENARRKDRLGTAGDSGEWNSRKRTWRSTVRPMDMLALDEALQQFEEREPRKAELVKLRYFAGLSEDEAAAALGISRATAARWWAFARAWLYDRIHGAES